MLKLGLKIIAVLLIQALFLTQADFALASMNDIRSSFKEAALKYQVMSSKSSSLIAGAGCVKLAQSGLHLPGITIKNLLSFLAGQDFSIVDFNKTAIDLRLLNNEFYKAFAILTGDVLYKEKPLGSTDEERIIRTCLVLLNALNTRAPPMLTAKIFNPLPEPNC